MGSTDRKPGQDGRQAPARQDAREARHSGQGARSALDRMKQWERSRAELNGDESADRPEAGASGAGAA